MTKETTKKIIDALILILNAISAVICTTSCANHL